MGVEIFKVMRAIKFRVWDGNKMWFPESETANGTNTTLHFFNSLRCIAWGLYDSVFGNRIATSEYHELMQYTGLKDVNGKEVYEGDVVAIHQDDSPDFNAEVFYHERWGAFEVAATGNTIGWYTDLKNCVTVIGNVHENPELL